MLVDLVERFGRGAIVTAYPRMLDSGKTYRWELEIDGRPEADVYARERAVSEDDPTRRVLVMVSGDDEVELGHWSTKRPEPVFTTTLGELWRRRA